MASHSTTAGPPVSLIFLSFPAEKNPTASLSGDQNGLKAPSVPGRGRAESELRSRTHNCDLPSPDPANTSRRPSGESAGTLPAENVVLSGGNTETRSKRGC